MAFGRKFVKWQLLFQKSPNPRSNKHPLLFSAPGSPAYSRMYLYSLLCELTWLSGENSRNGNSYFEKAQTPDQTNIHCRSVRWDLPPNATLECTTLSNVNRVGLRLSGILWLRGENSWNGNSECCHRCLRALGSPDMVSCGIAYFLSHSA